MDALTTADMLGEIIRGIEAGQFDGPVGRAELVRRLLALKRDTFPYDAEYYAVVGGYTGRIIGLCHRSGIPDVMAEEPLSTFRALTREEYERLRVQMDS